MLARLRKDCRGVSALEFALIAPVLILLFFGLAELSQAFTAKRRVSHAASAVGDLVAQADKATTQADLDNIFAAGRILLEPFSTHRFGLRITSVTGDANGVPKVDWTDADGAPTPKLDASGAVKLPTGLITAPGDTVIVADAVYSYNPLIAVVSQSGFTFRDRFYLHPRVMAKVVCTDCAPTP